jgi:hypothetical protein
MTNPFFTNNFTDRAKFMLDNPNTWQDSMKDAGLTDAGQRHPGMPVVSSWTINQMHRAAARKQAIAAVEASWDLSDIPEANPITVNIVSPTTVITGSDPVWKPIPLDQAIDAIKSQRRKPIKWQQLRTLVHSDKDLVIPGAAGCDCKLEAGHERWCHKWEAY